MNKDLKYFIIALFSIYAFTFLTISLYSAFVGKISENSKVIEAMVIIIIIITITYLAEKDKITEETVKIILATITGYILGSN